MWSHFLEIAERRDFLEIWSKSLENKDAEEVVVRGSRCLARPKLNTGNPKVWG
jgi:hypothetical protein